jgi:excisionase family DNA binding protein
MGKTRQTSADYMEEIALDLPTRIEHYRRALTVPELAEMTAISDKQIYSLIKRGSLPYYRIASSIRFDPKTTADWLRSQTA